MTFHLFELNNTFLVKGNTFLYLHSWLSLQYDKNGTAEGDYPTHPK